MYYHYNTRNKGLYVKGHYKRLLDNKCSSKSNPPSPLKNSSKRGRAKCHFSKELDFFKNQLNYRYGIRFGSNYDIKLLV